MTLGATLGISTMAAAAIGNWISDLSGIGYGISHGSVNHKLHILSCLHSPGS